MKKTLYAALAAPVLLMGLGFSSAASAQAHGPKYSGDAESQIERQRYNHAQRYGYQVMPPQVYDRTPSWDRDRPSWNNRNPRQAAPRGYRWQRYGDRYALVRRSDGAIVQWHR